MIKKEVVGYAIKSDGAYDSTPYAWPGKDNWRPERYLWPTREEALSEIARRPYLKNFAKILRVVRKVEVGYAIEDNPGDYFDPIEDAFVRTPYLWPTRAEAAQVYRDHRFCTSKIVEMPVVKRAPCAGAQAWVPPVAPKPPQKFVIRKRHVVEYDTRELAEQVAETYAGGSLCWMVVPS